MYICYIDEAGCTGTLTHSYSPIQPVFIICGIIIQQTNLTNLTHDFIKLKIKFYPTVFSGLHYLDCIKEEIKGSEVRKSLRGNRNQRRHALKFIDEILKILEKYKTAIIGRVWVKPISTPFNGRAVYTYSIQNMASCFQSFLISKDEHGIIVADSRNKEKNAIVSHSIFTQKYKPSGDTYDRILEMPFYGHSDNHAGLQLADLLASAIVFPISTSVFCSNHVKNTMHYDPHFLNIRTIFGNRLEDLQYRFKKDTSENIHGGLTVSDPISYRSGSKIFKP